MTAEYGKIELTTMDKILNLLLDYLLALIKFLRKSSGVNLPKVIANSLH